MSSSYHSRAGDAPAQRVPAWKRLGLKLKPASEGQSNDVAVPLHQHTSTTAVPNNRAPSSSTGTTPNWNAAGKRKASAGAPALVEHSTKRAKQDSWQQTQNTPPPKKPKSVSFTADTAAEPKTPSAPGAVPRKQKQRPPTPAKPALKSASPPAPATKPAVAKRSAPVNLEPALNYLRTWHKDRASWKFNKNHQTKLLEQVFAAETTIPAVDIGIFYEYIGGLKGGVRTRLRELANGVRSEDMEQGASAFAGSSSKQKQEKEMAERKQKEYEEVIKMFLGQPRTAEKRRFEEVDYVLRTTDMELQRRVVKRMRAEMVLEELSETDESETTTTATTMSAESESTAKEDGGEQVGGDGIDKRLSLNGASQQRIKRKRKLRTAAIEDDSSSSDSDSSSDDDEESGSGTSSSGDGDSSSSSEDSDDDDTAAGLARNDAETSSSSSSSSSESESGSDNED